jgi:hypothetical protein
MATQSSLMSKMLKVAGKESSILVDSDLAEKLVLCSTQVPIVNVMLSGKLDGGLKAGITQLLGASRSFKCVHEDTKLVIYVSDEIKAKYFSMKM